MKKSLRTFLNRSIVVLLLLVVLLTSVGSTTKVYALAQPAEPISELAPVFDTQIYQLTDYVQQSLTEPQLGIFYLLLGAWVVAQGGTNDYKLVDPYTTSDGVQGFLKSTGIQLYNSMLDLVGGKIYNPLTGTDMTPYLSMAVGYALGAAKTAKKYTDETDFVEHVNEQDHYFVPFDPVLQQSINAYFGRKGGLWNWQFDAEPFIANFSWNTSTYVSGLLLETYNDAVNTYLSGNKIKCNAPSLPTDYSWRYTNIQTSCALKYNLFVDTDNNISYLCDNSGDRLSDITQNVVFFQYSNRQVIISTINLSFVDATLNQSNYSTIVEYIQALLDGQVSIPGVTSNLISGTLIVPGASSVSGCRFDLTNIIEHYYAGTNWATKQEVFNIHGLNFAQSDEPQEYYPVPENTYLDIKGLLVDLVNNTDLLQIIFDNLFNDDGTLNIALPDIQVSITLPDSNPLPVNLNEIEVYTHNEYLDTVKKYSYDFADTIGEYVAFWHNADYEIVYALLGSVIIVMIGAFIGKWGHS